MTEPDPRSAEPAPETTAAPAPAPAATPAGGEAGSAQPAGPEGPHQGALDAPAEGQGGAPGAEGAGDEPRRKRRRRRRKGRGERGEGEPGQPGQPNQPGPPNQPNAGGRPSRKERHQQRRDRPRHRDEGGDHHAIEAVRHLARLAGSLLRVEGVDPLGLPRHMELNLRVPLDDDANLRPAASAAVEQILKRVREVREHEQALRPGSVFCYFHGSANAEGCRPAEPRQVFDGYGSTGRPKFSDFVTMAIERKDPQIDRLLAGEDVVVTHVTMGQVLRTQQLAEFGQHSPVYKILGQVDAGLFRVLGAEGRCAFSFQLLLGTTLEGRPRLRLHAVSAVDLMDLADPSVLHTLSRFQRLLDEESLRLAGKRTNGEVDEEAFVLPLLQDLAQKLAGRHRREARRTQHGLERSQEGQRPTARAYPDASEAGDEQILFDTEKSTIVVIGPKSRVHVFTPQARHVTSVVMQGSAIHGRRQQGRWREAEPDERGEFRIQLRQLMQSGEPPTANDGPVEP